jgi:hypothetical protein
LLADDDALGIIWKIDGGAQEPSLEILLIVPPHTSSLEVCKATVVVKLEVTDDI